MSRTSVDCPVPGCRETYSGSNTPAGKKHETQWHVVCTCGWVGFYIKHHQRRQTNPAEHEVKDRIKKDGVYIKRESQATKPPPRTEPEPEVPPNRKVDKLDPKALREALDALKIQNSINNLAGRYDPLLVMRVCREWVAYMDRQVHRANDHRPEVTL